MPQTTPLNEFAYATVFQSVLNANVDFRTGITGWSALAPATAAWAPLVGHDAPGSLEITPSGGAASTGQMEANGVRVIGGQRYTWQGWMMAPAGFPASSPFIRWRDAAGVTISTPALPNVALAPGVWLQHVQASALAPANAWTAQGSLRLIGPPNPLPADLFYIDDAQFIDLAQPAANNGMATVTVAPGGIERWNVTQIAVSVSSNVNEPIARVYKNQIAPSALIAGTYTGSLDSMGSSRGIPILQGDSLICVWEGADPGATATLSIFGEKVA